MMVDSERNPGNVGFAPRHEIWGLCPLQCAEASNDSSRDCCGPQTGQLQDEGRVAQALNESHNFEAHYNLKRSNPRTTACSQVILQQIMSQAFW